PVAGCHAVERSAVELAASAELVGSACGDPQRQPRSGHAQGHCGRGKPRTALVARSEPHPVRSSSPGCRRATPGPSPQSEPPAPADGSRSLGTATQSQHRQGKTEDLVMITERLHCPSCMHKSISVREATAYVCGTCGTALEPALSGSASLLGLVDAER